MVLSRNYNITVIGRKSIQRYAISGIGAIDDGPSDRRAAIDAAVDFGRIEEKQHSERRSGNLAQIFSWRAIGTSGDDRDDGHSSKA